MSLIDRVFAEPELRDMPPVLVDIGAAGGVHPAWRRIARFSIGVGFEPDVREAAPLDKAQREFKKWIFCPALVVAGPPPNAKALLHLTRSPQCSSTLRPRAAALEGWAFSGFFDVTETRMLPAATLADALRAQGLAHIDWLKCDTQGIDLGIFQSLPIDWRARMLAVEFEPGLIDAYEGEDKLPAVLSAMEREPFWLADLRVGRTTRGRRETFARLLGAGASDWVRRLGPTAPAWANAAYLRDVMVNANALDRRAYLLAWVFTTVAGQHGYALDVAEAGGRLFADSLFSEMVKASVHRLRLSMVRNFPAWLGRRFLRAR